MNRGSYKELIAWQKSMELVNAVYTLTSQLPQKELFGLASQINRAAVSIPSNIAEGYRRGDKEFAQFLAIASGSLAELETQLIIAQQNYASSCEEILQHCDEINRIIYALRKKLLKPES